MKWFIFSKAFKFVPAFIACYFWNNLFVFVNIFCSCVRKVIIFQVFIYSRFRKKYGEKLHERARSAGHEGTLTGRFNKEFDSTDISWNVSLIDPQLENHKCTRYGLLIYFLCNFVYFNNYFKCDIIAVQLQSKVFQT